jgi:integrase
VDGEGQMKRSDFLRSGAGDAHHTGVSTLKQGIRAARLNCEGGARVAGAPSPRGAVAQWSEQGTHNPSVAGSIPAGPTCSGGTKLVEPGGRDYNGTTLCGVQGTKTEIRPGVWRLRVYAGRRANGTPIQLSKTVRGPEEKPGSGTRLADRELAKMVAKVASGNAVTGAATMGDLLDRWLTHSDSLGRSPTTMRKYRQIVEAVVRPELGRLRLTKLTAADLDRLYAKLTAKGNKATTVRRVHALIGAALHQAERWSLVEHNVALRATPPPVHPAQVRAPTPHQVQAIVRKAEEVEPALAALILLAAATGARRGELCALRWSDVDWQDGTLTIARSVYETQGGGWAEKATKTHQERRIGLDDFALTLLDRHRAAVDALATHLGLVVRPHGYVFSRSPVGAEPYLPSLVTKFTTRMARAVGIDTHLHAMRHFSATEAIGDGADVVTVAHRLGHRDATTTLRIYAGALDRRDREVAASLGRVLAAASESSPENELPLHGGSDRGKG